MPRAQSAKRPTLVPVPTTLSAPTPSNCLLNTGVDRRPELLRPMPLTIDPVTTRLSLAALARRCRARPEPSPARVPGFSRFRHRSPFQPMVVVAVSLRLACRRRRSSS